MRTVRCFQVSFVRLNVSNYNGRQFLHSPYRIIAMREYLWSLYIKSEFQNNFSRLILIITRFRVFLFSLCCDCELQTHTVENVGNLRAVRLWQSLREVEWVVMTTNLFRQRLAVNRRDVCCENRSGLSDRSAAALSSWWASRWRTSTRRDLNDTCTADISRHVPPNRPRDPETLHS